MTNEHEANAVRLLNLAESRARDYGSEARSYTEMARVYAMLAANATHREAIARASARSYPTGLPERF